MICISLCIFFAFVSTPKITGRKWPLRQHCLYAMVLNTTLVWTWAHHLEKHLFLIKTFLWWIYHQHSWYMVPVINYPDCKKCLPCFQTGARVWAQGLASLRTESDKKAIWAVLGLLPLIFSSSLCTTLLQHLYFLVLLTGVNEPRSTAHLIVPWQCRWCEVPDKVIVLPRAYDIGELSHSVPSVLTFIL